MILFLSDRESQKLIDYSTLTSEKFNPRRVRTSYTMNLGWDDNRYGHKSTTATTYLVSSSGSTLLVLPRDLYRTR